MSLISLFIAFGVALIFKTLYVSPRPYSVLSNIRLVVRDNGLNSFPSGHMAISMSVISVVLMKIKNNRFILIALSIIYILILAFSLLYGGVHYPIDIIMGGLIGIVSAVITVSISNKYFNKFFEIQ